MRLATVHRIEEIREYAPAWDALVDSSPEVGLFETREWVESWIEAFEPQAELELIFVYGEDGAVYGLAPLLRRHGDCAGGRSRSSTLHNPHVRRCHFLLAGDAPSRVVSSFFEHLQQRQGGLPLILPSVATGSVTAAAVDEAVRARGMRSMAIAAPPSPFVERETTFEDYWASRSNQCRRELRRKQRKLEGAGKLRIATFERFEGEEGERAWNDVLQIERGSWKQDEGTSFVTEANVAPFYRRLAKRCGTRGWLRCHVMYLDDQPLAHMFGVELRGTYYALKTSYDAAARQLSPGQVLMRHCLEDALGHRGMRVFDFLGEPARWKDDLATGQRQHIDLCVAAATDIGCLACRGFRQQVKPVAKRALRPLLGWRARAQGWIRSSER